MKAFGKLATCMWRRLITADRESPANVPIRIPIHTLALLLLTVAAPTPTTAAAQRTTSASHPTIRVRLTTTAGAIVLALDARRAPKTTANFLAYVDDGRLDGTNFYRTVRRKSDPRFGFIQGGIGTDARRMLPSVALEPTSRTGLSHRDATVSMAHGANPDWANGNFSIMVGDNAALDARGSSPGYAAFGRVVAGMDVVRRILALPSGGGRDAMKGQMILRPVRILTARRLDGTPKPTGRVKPWLLGLPSTASQPTPLRSFRAKSRTRNVQPSPATAVD